LGILPFGNGYRRPNSSEVHSGQSLAVILASLNFIVYAIAGFLTVPVPSRAFWRAHHVAFLLWLLLALVPLTLLLVPALKARKQRVPTSKVVLALLCAGILFTGLSWGKCPVIDTLLILAIAGCWAGSETAFILDRYRIPVVTLTVGIVLLGTWIFAKDHVYQTQQDKRSGAGDCMLSPSDVVKNFRCLRPGEPMIIVTASGGGIHAAAWTATVLNGLETAFAASGRSFHRDILLMSSVSGGSVPAAYWAESYLDEALPPNIAFDVSCVVKMAECSSLEAAAWGVMYPDLNHLLVWKDFLLPGLAVYDRGWALQRAFERNRQPGCTWPDREIPSRDSEYTLTNLRDYILSPDDKDHDIVPAFAFNATLAGNGQRFLLSNYQPAAPPAPPCDVNARPSACPPQISPAASFFRMYPNLDLSLFAAARLSATYPYVSPTAAAMRPDGSIAPEHLADGGYYDNDGMASALEFLSSAYPPPTTPEGGVGLTGGSTAGNSNTRAPRPTQPNAPPPKDQIFLIEIRHDEEPMPPRQPTHGPRSNPTLGRVAEQLAAPVETVLAAWGDAQSLRNQQEYEFLRLALAGKVEFHHFIFAYCNESQRVLPLSWHLTEGDKRDMFDHWREYDVNAQRLAACFAASTPSGQQCSPQ